MNMKTFHSAFVAVANVSDEKTVCVIVLLKDPVLTGFQFTPKKKLARSITDLQFSKVDMR